MNCLKDLNPFLFIRKSPQNLQYRRCWCELRDFNFEEWQTRARLGLTALVEIQKSPQSVLRIADCKFRPTIKGWWFARTITLHSGQIKEFLTQTRIPRHASSAGTAAAMPYC